MGLRDDIQFNIGQAFDTDLADTVFSITLNQRGRGGYSPTTGDVTPPTDADFTSRGVFDNYEETEIFNSSIEPSDTRIIILQNELGTTPRIGNTITRTSDSKVFRIIKVDADPADATWECQARGTKQ